MKFVWLLCCLSVHIALTQASSHWMVTETGLVQPKDDSPFLMANPFDLLSFLNQDTRWKNIFNIYNNLIHRQKNIDRIWVKLEADADFDKHIAENKFCMRVQNIDLMDWYASFLEDGRYKGIPEKDFLLRRSKYGDTDIPDCKKISSLTFSMFAFEHLDSMANREHLNATPEYALPELFSPIMTVNQFGHWLSDVLHKNTSSWLHYNLAAIYWRVKGNVPKAIECSRRAVHYAPRQYKNVALLCLGSILHRSRHSYDATVVLGAAVDHDPGFAITHFALGAALAVNGDFNSSLKHLELSIKLHPGFQLAEKFRNGVFCHLNMFKKMKVARSSLKELSQSLQEYSNTENLWLKIMTAFLKTKKHDDDEDFDFTNVNSNCRIMAGVTGLDLLELRKDGNRNALVEYFIDSSTYNEEWDKETGVTALDTSLSLQKIIKHISRYIGMPNKRSLPTVERNETDILKEIGPMPSFLDRFPDPKRYKPRIQTEVRIENQRVIHLKPGNIEMGTLRADTEKPLYPSNFKVNRNREPFDLDSEWPSMRVCKESAHHFPEDMEMVYPVFLPFENKGIKLSYLLTEKIGVPALVEHQLPWHPPVCPSDMELALYTQKKGFKVHLAPEAVSYEILKLKLLRYLSDTHLDIIRNMQDAEIGQRIQTAIEKQLAPGWMLYTIASLYWRVRGNVPYALNCLLTASRIAQPNQRDVVLVSMASLFLEMGLLDECAKHIEEAYKMSPYEPETNFVLAQLSMVKKSQVPHMFHLKQVIRVDGRFLGGLARSILIAWACLIKQLDNIQKIAGYGEKEICAEFEPGLTMVCERDGTNCRVTTQSCVNNGAKRETSQIVRMLELRDDKIQGAPVYDLTDTIFDKYIAGVPSDRTNKLAHQKSYDAMLKTVHRMLKGCSAKGCTRMKTDDSGIRKEECSMQKLQLDYWLHTIGLRQQLSDTDNTLDLPMNVLAIQPKFTKKIPECRIPTRWANDFYLEQMMMVDTSEWVPSLSLMHQFTELFGLYDYELLGSKIAQYIETPASWLGLIVAGWWCGASGRGACAVRCFTAAHAVSPLRYQPFSLRSLTTLLHIQLKHDDAKDIAYLSFYMAPKNKIDAFLVAVSHFYREEYEYSVWMYRYALTFDQQFLPVKACLHISMCVILYGDITKKQINEIPE